MTSARFRALGKYVVASSLAAAVLCCVLPAQGQVSGFTDDLSPANWVDQREYGTIYFTNANTELFVLGPTGLLYSNVSSADSILYAGPSGTGLPSSGILSFDWYFNSGDAQSSQADFSWTTSSGPQQQTLAGDGPGTIDFGTVSLTLDREAQFSFLLTTLNADGKQTPAELIINNVQFTIPEPSVAATLSCGLALAALLRWRKKPQGLV